MSNGNAGRDDNGVMDRSPPEPTVDASGEEELRNKLVDEVFGNHLLGDIIFGCAFDFKSRTDLCNFRLVSKVWKEAVSNFLKHESKPLYVVKMTRSNSLNEAPEVKKNGKVLDSFLHFLHTREDQDSYAGFCLKMEDGVFCLENYAYLVTCLEQCAQHLVEMRLKVPANGVDFPGPLPDTLKLLELRKLRLCTVDEMFSNPPTTGAMPFIQSLWKQNSVLKHVDFEWMFPEFQDAELPPSLVKIELSNCENPRLLECLTRNNLPELKELTLDFTNDIVFPENDLLFQVLDKLRHDLRVLNITDFGDGESELTLHFPDMESLVRLHLEGSCILLSMATASPSFPKLTRVELDKNLVTQFRSPIPSVTTVQIAIDLLEDEDFSLNLLKDVKRTFPNLTDLRLDGIDRLHPTDVQYLFREMRQLKRLSITAAPGGAMPSDHWDAALIGTPVEFVQGLKVCPCEFWKNLKMDIQTGNSIKMLKDLTYLRLYAYRYDESYGPLISELAFIFALNEMANLEHVELGGRFSASKEIVEEWEARGRKIEYESLRVVSYDEKCP